MTEQERIEAIDALTKLLYPNASNALGEEAMDGVRDATVNMLHELHDLDMLEDYAICYHLLQKPWVDATPQEVAICENAAQAMREAIAEEGRKE